MRLRISNLKIPYQNAMAQQKIYLAKKLGIPQDAIEEITTVRASLDCRKKPTLYCVYTVDVLLKDGACKTKKLLRMPDVREALHHTYEFVIDGERILEHRPVIVGAGPAGLFCALQLARAGYRPLIIEQGKNVADRQKDVDRFWKDGTLLKDSNVQFGEGGAGTFSDGKLNTLVKDKDGYGHKVLEEFVRFGADERILYEAKPHVGTDVLAQILVKIRDEIKQLGGTYLFETKLISIEEVSEDRALIKLSDGQKITTDVLVLAIGNSARDTFEMLYEKGLPILQKPFAVGFRVEHPQEMINENAYGRAKLKDGLEAASYKVTAQVGGRGIYSFCMCPGGYVVNASSEDGRLAVNGMSYHDRGSRNANAAIVVTVDEKDFGSDDPLAGLNYQRMLEEKAYKLGNGRLVQQLFGDFCNNRTTTGYGSFASEHKGQQVFANLRGLFPESWNETFIEAMHQFGKKIPRFDREDAVLTALESRTSSPVKVLRTPDGICENSCIYPCGEGAGYAGGIVSAGIDGLRCAQHIAHKFSKLGDKIG